MSRFFIYIVAFIGVALCTACVRQVGYSALEMQESYRTLLFKQILYNLKQAMLAKDQTATRGNVAYLPSQVLIVGGGANVTGSITPNVGVPLPTGTITDSIAQGISSTYTHGSAVNLGNASLGVSMSDSNQVSWTLTPQTDPDALRRLRGLYLFAVGALTPECDVRKSDTTSSDAATYDCLWNQYPMQGGSAHPNPAFLEQPGCVFCVTPSGARTNATTSCPTVFEMNPILYRLAGFISDKPIEPNWIPLKTDYGLATFYVKPSVGEGGFNDFVLFILEAMSIAPPTASNKTCQPSASIGSSPPTPLPEWTHDTSRRNGFKETVRPPSAPPLIAPSPSATTQTLPSKSQTNLPLALPIQ